MRAADRAKKLSGDFRENFRQFENDVPKEIFGRNSLNSFSGINFMTLALPRQDGSCPKIIKKGVRKITQNPSVPLIGDDRDNPKKEAVVLRNYWPTSAD